MSGTPVWHGLAAHEVARRLGVAPLQGLSPASARERLATSGPNRLAEVPPRAPWLRLLDQFRSVLIVVLIFAAGVAGAMGDVTDMAVILLVVVFNACLGFYQEHRAEASLAALKSMLAQRARVRRDGHKMEIAADDLVPGDLVLLEAGDKVPADGRLIATHSAEFDESALTGESQPVAKQAEAIADADAPLAERSGMAYMNTVVTRGRAELIVTATGMASEMGRIAGMIQAAPETGTPLQRQLDRLGKRLATIACVVVALIFLLSLVQGETLAVASLTAITLAVAAIPEGLPAVVTVTLALGMRRMARRRAIVKRLAAVETLGSTTVICSDKTGTLTLNQMTARAIYFAGRRYSVSGEGYEARGEIRAEDGEPADDLEPLLLPAALCNDSRIREGKLIGDPTEGALAALAAKAGTLPEVVCTAQPRVAEIPFDSAAKFMVTFHETADGLRLHVKGAPDVLLQRCTQLWRGTAVALDDTQRGELATQMAALTQQGLRVLALASRSAPAGAQYAADPGQFVADLCLIGLVGIVDPPRPEAREAIALCRQAGISVKMITGDHAATAATIADELGITGDVVSGAELDVLSDEALCGRVESVAVFARVAPEHKLRIVQALQRQGHVVAMTGDGVNDAPALKSADIGVAMGITGTEVSKEAGAMVLTDDNFASIVGAVHEGRTLYDNIIKFVRFQLATNMGALACVLTASLLGWPIPFNPIQILWVNMIMDGPPAMALGVDPPRHGLMNEAPRARDADILPWARLGKLAAFGATMAVGTLAVYAWALDGGDQTRAGTLAFTTFVMCQFFNLFNARAERGSAFTQNFFGNRMLWAAIVVGVSLHVAAVHWPPAQQVFHTTALSPSEWLLAVGVASLVLLLEEARKLAALLIARA